VKKKHASMTPNSKVVASVQGWHKLFCGIPTVLHEICDYSELLQLLVQTRLALKLPHRFGFFDNVVFDFDVFENSFDHHVGVFQFVVRKRRVQLSNYLIAFETKNARFKMFTHQSHLAATHAKLSSSWAKYVLSTMGVSKESISKFLIGNRLHVKLRILSPYSNRICATEPSDG